MSEMLCAVIDWTVEDQLHCYDALFGLKHPWVGRQPWGGKLGSIIKNKERQEFETRCCGSHRVCLECCPKKDWPTRVTTNGFRCTGNVGGLRQPDHASCGIGALKASSVDRVCDEAVYKPPRVGKQSLSFLPRKSSDKSYPVQISRIMRFGWEPTRPSRLISRALLSGKRTVHIRALHVHHTI